MSYTNDKISVEYTTDPRLRLIVEPKLTKQEQAMANNLMEKFMNHNEENQLGFCLDEAKKIINGHRQDEYGKPENSFEYIAKLWEIFLNHLDWPLDPHKLNELKPSDVALMMILYKVARASHSYSYDSAVDIAGYAALYDELSKKNNETV